jgi:hypothetical protein
MTLTHQSDEGWIGEPLSAFSAHGTLTQPYFLAGLPLPATCDEEGGPSHHRGELPVS